MKQSGSSLDTRSCLRFIAAGRVGDAQRKINVGDACELVSSLAEEISQQYVHISN
jgi:hypothetical protein